MTEDNRSGQPVKYTVLHEARLTALACGPVPEGRRRWTIRLLVAELNKQRGFETITFGSVRKLLKKNELKPWLRRMWCIQEITEEYRARMYRLLELHQQEYDSSQPLVCMDEKSKQLLEDSRQPIQAKPGKLEKYDYASALMSVNDGTMCVHGWFVLKNIRNILSSMFFG